MPCASSSTNSKPRAEPAATGCSIWRRRRTPSRRSAASSAAPACWREERRVAAAGGRETVRHRSRLRQGAEQRTAQAVDEHADLPHRPLSRQGDGPEHPGAALRQRHVRADLESQPHRSRADHRRRDSSASAGAAASTTQTGALRDMVPNHLFQLLSLVAMEPPIALRRAMRCAPRRPRCSPRSSRRARRRRCAIRCAGNIAPARSAISRSQDYRKKPRCRARQHHRDLCGAEARHRQLALGRRAVLPAHRQGAGVKRDRGRDQVQAGAVRDVSTTRRRAPGAELPRDRHRSRTKASRCSSTPRCRGRRSRSTVSR